MVERECAPVVAFRVDLYRYVRLVSDHGLNAPVVAFRVDLYRYVRLVSDHRFFFGGDLEPMLD